jgi:shikimate kinase
MENILLTGPKHSGKTTAGKILAELYSCDFFDLDDLIFQKTGKSPRQLCIENPQKFMNVETEVLIECTSGINHRVIAAGGGIIDNPDAVALMKKLKAVIVFLDIPAKTAWDRIINPINPVKKMSIEKINLPPFLKTVNPRETHRILHERRAAAYSQLAEYTIKAEGKTPKEIAAEIFKINYGTTISEAALPSRE